MYRQLSDDELILAEIDNGGPIEDWDEFMAYVHGELPEFLFDKANAELEAVADYSL
jgi:hypothetical protein|tara:strand:- start:1615 stop:1782 length:168 start_codon:yes stop_codon:yes gene_type:complete